DDDAGKTEETRRSKGGVPEPGAPNRLLHDTASPIYHPGGGVLPDSLLALPELPPGEHKRRRELRGLPELRPDVPEHRVPRRAEEYFDLHRGQCVLRVCDRARHRAGHKPGVQGPGAGEGGDPGAVGFPDGYLGGHVAVDVPGSGRHHPVCGQHSGYHQRSDTLQPDAAPDRGHPRRYLENDTVYGASDPCRPADHPRRGLRGRPGGRCECLATLLQDNFALAQAGYTGSGAVPYVGRVPDLRPVLGDEQPGAGVLEHVRVQGREDQPTQLRGRQRRLGIYLYNGVLDRDLLYQGPRHADFDGGV
ncbi:MAG: Maltodextrin ABC transporter, permease protein MdxF, partial [uncultured Rubrobacteraceae bacterium]